MASVFSGSGAKALLLHPSRVAKSSGTELLCAFALRILGLDLSKVLAPSNVGYTQRSISGVVSWKPHNSTPPFLTVIADPTVLSHYKSSTVHSDGHAPTNYCRMINKIVPGGAVDCTNYPSGRWYNQYDYKSDIALTVGVKSKGLPFGCDIPNGVVQVPEWMVDAVVSDCLADLNGISTNIYEDLGQAAEPFRMYVSTYRAIILLYLSARAGKWNHVRRWFSQNIGTDIPRAIGNGWLMYFYGIKPLIGTLDTLVEQSKPRDCYYAARARREISVPSKSYTTAGAWVRSGSSVKVSAQCQLMATVSVNADTSYYRRLGITGHPSDALVTAWALTPWSFVVDWVLPVEQFLRSLVWMPTLKYEGGFVGRRHHGGGTLTDPWPWSGSFPYTGAIPKYHHQVRFYRRTTYPYRVPTVGLNMRFMLNSNQIKSAAALLVTR